MPLVYSHISHLFFFWLHIDIAELFWVQTCMKSPFPLWYVVWVVAWRVVWASQAARAAAALAAAPAAPAHILFIYAVQARV